MKTLVEKAELSHGELKALSQDQPLGGVTDSQDDTRTPEEPAVDVLKRFNLVQWVKDSTLFYFKRPNTLKTEVLSGITLALIEVPEAVAFSFMAGVHPYSGMASVFFVGTITGLFGGRPAMISGAAGAMAVVLGDLTRDNGPLKSFTYDQRVEQLYMCVVFIGAIGLVVGPLLCAFVKIIPQTVMIGFMDALAIILVKAQLESFQVCTEPDGLFTNCSSDNKVWLSIQSGQTWATLALVAVTMFVMWGMPRLPGRIGHQIGHLVPASLAAIVVGTIVEWGIFRPLIGIKTRTVRETAPLASGLPGFHVPQLPPNPEWGTILAYAASLCLIGLVETVMTHEVVNAVVHDPPSTFKSNQECFAQALANLVCGFFGAMGGSALIGESVINVVHGAKYRMSQVSAGITMLIIMVALGNAVSLMPIATLAGVIFTVVVHTFQWKNFTELHRIPTAEAFIIIVVTVISVVTNLAIGVAVGVALSSMWHVWSSGMAIRAGAVTGLMETAEGPIKAKVYNIDGEVFFGSTRPLLRLFDYDNDPRIVVINVRSILDMSGVVALDDVGKRYAEHGKSVVIRGLDDRSIALLKRCRSHTHHLTILPLDVEEKTEDVEHSNGRGSGNDLTNPVEWEGVEVVPHD